MALWESIAELRTAGTRLHDFHLTHIPDTKDGDRIFEFAVLMELVEQLLAGGWHGEIVRTRLDAFAQGHALRKNYNFIRVGPFHLYFNVQFVGFHGVAHAPDVALSHESAPERPIHIRECKHYPGRKVKKEVVTNFLFIVDDLHRPVFENSLGRDIVIGTTWGARATVHAPADAEALERLIGDVRSVLFTSGTGTSEPMEKLAANFGCRVEARTWTPR